MRSLEIYLQDILFVFSGFKHLQGILTLRSKTDTQTHVKDSYVPTIGCPDIVISGFETEN
jgi:hypothetical protein